MKKSLLNISKLLFVLGLVCFVNNQGYAQDISKSEVVLSDNSDLVLSVQPNIEQKVYIHSKVMQVVLNDENEEGIDWEAIADDFCLLDEVSRNEGLETSKFSFQNISSGIITKDDYSVLLEALDTVGAITYDKERQYECFGKESLKIEVEGVSLWNPQREDFKVLASDGLEFEITSRVKDGFELEILPEVVFTQDDNELRKKIKTKDVHYLKNQSIKVNYFDTLVIGGLVKDIDIIAPKKIPLLGDIPLLGFAFRNKGINKRKSEIIVFITPRKAEEL